MKKSVLMMLLLAVSCSVFSQKEPKKSAKEVLEELPEMLIAQPDKGPDTLADKLVNFNLQLTVPPVWKEKGALIFSDFKVAKADKEPLDKTLPVPDKKIAQGIQITMNTVKKTVGDKKEEVLKQLKTTVTKLYKDNGETLSAADLDEKVKSLVSAPENFTTNEGRSGELCYINDIQGQETALVMLLLVPGADGKSSHFVYFKYFRYNYETNLPEDLLEWRMFLYPDEQEAYVNFTKKILKTLVIR